MQGKRIGDEVVELGFGKPGHTRDMSAVGIEIRAKASMAAAMLAQAQAVSQQHFNETEAFGMGSGLPGPSFGHGVAFPTRMTGLPPPGPGFNSGVGSRAPRGGPFGLAGTASPASAPSGFQDHSDHVHTHPAWSLFGGGRSRS
jgi:hypothetical protein